MNFTPSPLRYPGGKAELGLYVESLIKSQGLTGSKFYEPFAGGAAVALYLLQKDIVDSVVLNERDPLLFSFWMSVFKHTEELCNKIETTPINIETWDELAVFRQVDIPASNLIIELGFAALFFNRTNFSGILKAGPIGGRKQLSKYSIDCRFKKDRLINDILSLSKYCNQVQVTWSDGIQLLSENRRELTMSRSFVYIDPPYYSKGKSLYRHYFTDIQHERLADLLSKSNYPWLLSYDNCEFINQLYSVDEGNITRQNLYFDYSVHTAKRGSELLISNLEIPPVVQACQSEAGFA